MKRKFTGLHSMKLPHTKLREEIFTIIYMGCVCHIKSWNWSQASGTEKEKVAGQ